METAGSIGSNIKAVILFECCRWEAEAELYILMVVVQLFNRCFVGRLRRYSVALAGMGSPAGGLLVL